jgi:hypothetical protein
MISLMMPSLILFTSILCSSECAFQCVRVWWSFHGLAAKSLSDRSSCMCVRMCVYVYVRWMYVCMYVCHYQLDYHGRKDFLLTMTINDRLHVVNIVHNWISIDVNIKNDVIQCCPNVEWSVSIRNDHWPVDDIQLFRRKNINREWTKNEMNWWVDRMKETWFELTLTTTRLKHFSRTIFNVAVKSQYIVHDRSVRMMSISLCLQWFIEIMNDTFGTRNSGSGDFRFISHSSCWWQGASVSFRILLRWFDSLHRHRLRFIDMRMRERERERETETERKYFLRTIDAFSFRVSFVAH